MIKLPKGIFKLSFSKIVSIFLSFSAVLFIVYFGLLCIEGLRISSKTDYSLNYSSHIQVKSDRYHKKYIYDPSTWWYSRIPQVDDLSSIPFMRDSTTRTTIAGYYDDEPVRIIGVENNDRLVFNPLLYPPDSILLGEDQVFIGSELAKKHKLDTKSNINLQIPIDNHVLSNLCVIYTLPSINPVIDNHTIFINQKKLSDLFNTQFTDYHIKTGSSTFSSLLVSNVLPILAPNVILEIDDQLSYPFKILEILEKDLMAWGGLLFFFLGVIFFFIQYSHRNIYENDLQDFFYRIGVLNIPRYAIKLLWEGFKIIVGVSLFNLIISFAVFMFAGEIYANPFISLTGLFNEYHLPLDYAFTPVFDLLTLWGFTLRGIGLFLLGQGFGLGMEYFLNKIFESSNNQGVVNLLLFSIGLLGYLASSEYFYHASASKGRENQWIRHHFGNQTLMSKNYMKTLSLDLNSEHFAIDTNLLETLKTQKIPHLVTKESMAYVDEFRSLETRGYTKKKKVKIISVTGYEYPDFNGLIQAGESNEIIISSNILLSIDTDTKILSLSKTNLDVSNTTISVSGVRVAESAFEDIIYLDAGRFNTLTGIPNNHISKLQILKSYPDIYKHTNENVIVQEGYKSIQFWQKLSTLVLESNFIKSFIFLIIILGINLIFFLFYLLKNETSLIYNYIWGNKIVSEQLYFIKSSGIILIGLGIAQFQNLLYIINKSKLPDFLHLMPYTQLEVVFGIDWLRYGILNIVVIILSGICILITKIVLKKFIKNRIQYEFQKNLSS